VKYKKWLYISFIIILVIFILVNGVRKLNIEYTNKFISPKKTNLIKIEAKGVKGFLLFGSSDIKIKYRKNNIIGLINQVNINTSISNDGVKIDDSNINIEWISEDLATIILSGTEQDEEVININFDDISSYKK